MVISGKLNLIYRAVALFSQLGIVWMFGFSSLSGPGDIEAVRSVSAFIAPGTIQSVRKLVSEVLKDDLHRSAVHAS